MTMDKGRIKKARETLYSGVISDVLDSLGYREHNMRFDIRPLDDKMVIFGRARTALYASIYHIETGPNPYGLETELIDDLKSDDVTVIACPQDDRIVLWGELLSTASRARGSAGCVTDGAVRDVRFIRQMNFPVFTRAIGPLDSRGRGIMAKIDVPVECGGTKVSPGDWIFGDVDGVVVIPEKLAEETLRLALDKQKLEGTAREELARGDLLRDVYARHGFV